jgi:hypothetical protein
MQAAFYSLGGGETVMAVIIAAGRLVLAQRAPTGPVLDDPVEQGFFKTDVMSHFFALNPFMAENFCPFGQKFLIES